MRHIDNARALRIAQEAYDNAEPIDDGYSEWLEQQAKLLLSGQDADHVPFMSTSTQRGFIDEADELLCSTSDADYSIVRMVLALDANKVDEAKALARKLMLRLDLLAVQIIKREEQ